jgi:hypothetical protein
VADVWVLQNVLKGCVSHRLAEQTVINKCARKETVSNSVLRELAKVREKNTRLLK